MRNNSVRSYESERGYYRTAPGLGADDYSGDVTAVDTMPATTPSGAITRQAESTPWYQTLAQTLVPAALSVYQQQQLTKLNIARMNSNQPPLSAVDYARLYQPPAAQFQVGPTDTAKKLIIGAGVLVLGYVGLKAARVIK